MFLQVAIELKDPVCIVKVSGELGNFGILLCRVIPGLLKLTLPNGKTPSILLDLHNATRLEDVAKAYLIATKTEVKRKGGRFALLNISDGVARSLKASKISKVFKQFPSWKLKTSKKYVTASSKRKRALAEAEAILFFS